MNQALADLRNHLHTMPWTADPDTHQNPDGLTLAAEIADGVRAALIHYQADTLGDSYDEDTDAVWQAVMDGSIETAAEAEAYIMNLPDHDA
jgi:hypothetical protein